MIRIDTERGLITTGRRTVRLDEPEGFALLSDAWMNAAIRIKHPYTFTWLGRPVIQFADDLLRLQELVYQAQPDVIIETGVAHGGSLIFHASVCRLLGRGRVVGIDVEIRPHNRAAIEAHPLSALITLFEGSSIAADTVSAVAANVGAGQRALVVLDSNHTRDHVLAELDAYGPLVGLGSFMVAMDGHIMAIASGTPAAAADWPTNNSNAAVRDFAAAHPEFEHAEPSLLFNESALTAPLSGFRGGVLRRIR